MEESRKRKHHRHHKKSSHHDSDHERHHRKKKREERAADENEMPRKRLGDDSDEESFNDRERHREEIDDSDLKNESTERVKHRDGSRKKHRKRGHDESDTKGEYEERITKYEDGDDDDEQYVRRKGDDDDRRRRRERYDKDSDRHKTRKGYDSDFKEPYPEREKYSEDKKRHRKKRNYDENSSDIKEPYPENEKYSEDRERHRKRRNYDEDSYGRGRGMYTDDSERYSARKCDEFDSKQSSKKNNVGPRYYSTGVSEEKQDSTKESKVDKSGENEKEDETSTPAAPDVITPAQKKTVDLLTSRTGGAYIPPAKLRLMQASITDKTSAAYQRIAWEALKKSIHGQINKVTTENIGIIVRELLRENIVRGRGLLCRSIIQAQAASPTFTNVYAALVSVINSKFPNIGELLLRRCVIQFRRGYKRNDKPICISAATFVAHLVNQRVAHEILALEILTLLVETPTEDSVEVAIAFLKECGSKLLEVSNKGMRSIFEMLRNILHEGKLSKKVQYMIEVMFQVWKDEFKDHKPVIEELDLVEEMEQFTHLITLDEATDGEDILNVFKYDPEYETNEEKYKTLQREILGESDSGSDEDESGSDDDDDEDDDDSDAPAGGEASNKQTIIDNTETNLVALRKTIYLTIHSSLDFEECAHKLLRMQLKPGQEIEMCHMFLDCCAEQRTYEKFFGLLAERFCQINKIYVAPFEQIFKDSYTTIHRVETNKLRNVAKLFAHLLHTDAISWEVLSIIRLNEEDTTSSSRIFIKILFLELSEFMGMFNLNQRVKDPSLQTALEGLFPHDNPKNTRFAINFFTSIGLGSLTDELREHLKAQPKQSSVPQLIEALSTTSSDSSSSSSDDSSSDDSSSSSSSESEDSGQERKKKKKKPASKVKSREKENGRKSEKSRSAKSVQKRNSDSEESDHHRSKKNADKKKSISKDKSRSQSRQSSKDYSSSKHNPKKSRNKR
ncbi:pre-mRNA-splicing factor CWC22 homolog isoform X2 [Nilaparvata lugens]|nr:pre-mRNA-splicing factor CWC22 homolog isoform X2 [Nilaparvata lugens]